MLSTLIFKRPLRQFAIALLFLVAGASSPWAMAPNAPSPFRAAATKPASAVVQAIFMVIVADATFSIFFAAVGV